MCVFTRIRFIAKRWVPFLPKSEFMNWIDKITDLTTKTDDSPELKRGQIKTILTEQVSKILPDFEFKVYKGSEYRFGRTRNFRNYKLTETLHIMFGLKDKNFACSISSSLNEDYADSNSYNTGLINPHTDLIVLKKGTGVISIDEAYYFHNGRLKTTTKVVEQIINDYKEFGIPFLDKQYKRLTDSQIIKVGLAYIEKLTVDRKILKREIEESLNAPGQRISVVRHLIYDDLKAKLFAVSGLTKEDRQKIDKLTFELLELYYDSE